MQRKDAEREKAKKLRAEGWTLRRIASELGVALSSVSVWVRDVNSSDRRPVDIAAVLVAGGFTVGSLTSLPVVRSSTELRSCGKCRRRLSEQHFGRHPENGRQWWCKSCFREYFANRGQLHRDQVAESTRRRRRQGRQLVDRYMARGCCDCGAKDRLVLELDHHGGGKTANVSDMVRNATAPKRVQAELERCEVVCVNCHRIRTLSRLPKTWRIQPDLIEASTAYSKGARRNMLYVRAYLEASCCIDCDLDDLRVLEFDHVFGKTADVTVLAREGFSLNRLQDEVSRCEVRCGNCHRRRTVLEYRRRAGYLA